MNKQQQSPTMKVDTCLTDIDTVLIIALVFSLHIKIALVLNSVHLKLCITLVESVFLLAFPVFLIHT